MVTDKTQLRASVGKPAIWLLVLTPVLIMGGVTVYFLCQRYDFPFRLAGRYEKALFLMGRPFCISPDGSFIVYSTIHTGHGDIYRASSDGSDVCRLTDDKEYEGNPSYSPDGRRIVFTRETSKCGHIWTMNADGTGQQQLTFGSDYDADPIYAPDGRQIWFSRTAWGSSAGSYSLYTMTPNGRDVTPLDRQNRHTGEQAAFSPKDAWVYYLGVERYGFTKGRSLDEIWKMRPDTKVKYFVGNGCHPAVSPDSRRIAFVDGAGLWTMDTNGSRRKCVYKSRSSKDFVVFHPDGHQLFFLEEGNSGIYISSVRIDGSYYKRIIGLF